MAKRLSAIDEAERRGGYEMTKRDNGPQTTKILLDVSELAARLGLRPSWVYAHAGELGAYRLGKYLRFDWQRVTERLERFGTLGQAPSDSL